MQDAQCNLEKLVFSDLEEFSSRISLQDIDQGFVVVSARWKSSAGKDATKLVADHRDVTRVRMIGCSGVEAEEAPFAHAVSVAVEALDANIVHVGGPVNRG